MDLQLQRSMESRLTGLKEFVGYYKDDADERLRKLEKKSADKFLERIAHILGKDGMSVPEGYDRFKLSEVSERADDWETRKAAMELREEIDRRLRA